MTKRCSALTPDSASSSSGSTISTRAPECSTMYSTSGGARRKFTGTRMRPLPLTPKKLVSRRAEFWLTTATRSP